MTMMRYYSPFREIQNLQREMSHLFDTLSPLANSQDKLDFVPAAEMEETPEAIHLKLEIPGIDPSDIDVKVTAESVSISGQRQEETKTEEKGKTRTEFRYGQFSRTIGLPARVQNTEAQAEYKDGILKLTVPKAEAEKNKVVKVNIG